MGNPNLTKILIASLVGIFLISVLFVSYSGFVDVNNVTLEPKYAAVFSTISSQYTNTSLLAGETGIANQGIVRNILDIGKSGITSALNVFVVGLEAVGGFFSLIPIVKTIVNSISNVLPGIDALLGLFTTIFVLYIAMSYIKSVSNKTELP